MRLFSMYSGIGAFEKALENLNIKYQLVGFSEIDKWAIESYCAIHNVSNELNYGDINKIDEKQLPDFDLMTYGFPCQSFSVAGKRLGFEDIERGNLFFESMRIANYKKPKYLIAENVKGLVNHDKGETFKIVLETLEGIGYNNYYQVLNAKDYGIPQNRERIFIISIRKDTDNGKFEFPNPFELTTKLRDLLDDEVGEKYFLSDEYHSNFIYNLNNKTVEHLKSESKGSYDILGTTLGTKAKGTNSRHWVHDTNKTISTLSATDYKQPKQILVGKVDLLLHDLLEREGEIETPTIVASRDRNKENPNDRTSGNKVEQRLEVNSQGLSNTLTTVQKDNLVLVGKLDIKGHDQVKRVYSPEGICPTLTTMNGGHREPKVIVKETTSKGYGIATEEDSINISFPKSKTRRGRVGKGVAQTLDTQCNQAVLQANHTELPCIYDDRDKGFNGLKTSDICPTQRAERHGLKCITEDYKIRKLTPLECWRLMGFTDNDYWAARTRLEETFYKGKDKSNSQMYKQAGNSIVVPVLESIFRSLLNKTDIL